MKLKPSLSLPSLGRLLKDRLLYPPPGWPPQLSRACTLKTTGLEKVRGFFISLLLGHFNHSDTRSGPFMEKKKALSTFGVSAASPHWGAGALSFLGCLWLGTQLPDCCLEAVHLWDVLGVNLGPYTWRQNCGKKPLDSSKSAFALTEALSAGVPVLEWQ